MDHKLTFIVPIYNAEKWLETNFNFWVEVKEFAHLLFIEDSLDEKAKDIANKIGAEYYSKKNGNWGSVINFVKEKKLVETDYFAIVDADDTVNIAEFKKLLESMNNDHFSKDFYITNVIKKSYVDGKETILDKSRFGKNGTVPFIHSIWLKTKLLYDLPLLPENTFYSDNLVITFAQTKENLKFKFVDCAPYVHLIDLPGQSISQFKNPRPDFIRNFYQFLDFDKYIQETENKVHYKNANNRAIYNLSILYSFTNNNETKEKAFNEVRKYAKRVKQPLFFMWLYFNGSRLFRAKTRRKLNKEW